MLSNIKTNEQLRALFSANVTFLDVRAEKEFIKGHFPNAHNLPILNNEEHHLVGLCYKEKGRIAAIKLGHSIVTGDVKHQRIKAWCDFATSHLNTHLYCWRGGMRSSYAQQWMKDSGVEIPMINGGFKALRAVLMNEIKNTALHIPMIRIGGKTGTSKTILINEIEFSTDLEGHANHRGSSFGRQVSEVATQVSFENSLGVDLIKKRNAYPERSLVIEDESRRIGSCEIPKVFFEAMRSGPIGLIEMPMELRIDRIIQDYVINMSQQFLDAHAKHGWKLYVDYLTQSLFRVKKRLGLSQFKKINDLMRSALNKHSNNGDIIGHRAWIQVLLNEYYDPMYEYQISKQTNDIAFQGCYNDVLAWASNRSASGI